MSEKRAIKAMDAMLRDYKKLVPSVGKIPAAAALVAAGRLVLMDLELYDRVEVERLVENLLP